MPTISALAMDRRSFLVGSESLAAAVSLPRESGGAVAPAKEFTSLAGPGRVPLIGSPYPETDVWSYSGCAPGPEIQARQGERLRIAVNNRLAQDTTIHWHGVRVPNAMDGVPHLTQKPIPAGTASSTNATCLMPARITTPTITAPSRSAAVSGARIVEEIEPLPIDRGWSGCWAIGDRRATHRSSMISATAWMRPWRA